jgi:dTDP-4-dehydrorhamnose reductase
MKVAVIGAGGQLGTAIVQEFKRAGGCEIQPFTHAQLDVTDDAALERALAAARPQAIVNCTGFNEVDAAERCPTDALQVNAFAVRTMARLAEQVGAAFVHYGTDFVFDGTATVPYTEEDRPGPRSVYAASKMLGEWFALDASRGFVLRVESLFGQAAGGPRPRGSVASIMNALLAGTSPRVFEDRTVSPTYIIDAARATRALLEKNAAPGLYHCVNTGSCTWLEFARELARLLGVAPKVTAVKMADVVLPAQRPQFCALSNEKLRRCGIEMPTWQDALSRFVGQQQESLRSS